jgi:hypothetical protein
MTGQPIDTTKGGGFEFFGPYTEDEASIVRERMISKGEAGSWIAIAIQLIKYKLGDHPENYLMKK